MSKEALRRNRAPIGGNEVLLSLEALWVAGQMYSARVEADALLRRLRTQA